MATQRNGTGISAEFAQKNTNTPAAATDLANKLYVDSVAAGLSPKTSVVASTAAVIAANTYANGVSGVGATITFTAAGAQTVDGVVPALGERILVKDEVAGNALKNGIYVVTVKGTGVVQEVWTRTTDCDQSGDFPGAFVFTESGTVNTGAGFVCTNTAGVVVGTTAITWTQFSGLGQITAGAGLTKTGNTLNVGAGDGIQADADSVTVKLDGTTLTKAAAGLKVSDAVPDLAKQDTYWLKTFFSDLGLLPSTKIFEDLSTYRAPDFSVLNTASAPTRLRSRAKFTVGASSPATYGWDLGANYSKVLFIVGMARNPGVIAGTSVFVFIGKTLPATSLPKDAYFFGSEASSNRVGFYRTDGTPTATLIASDATVSPQGIQGADCSLGLYVDSVNHVQIFFMKMGGTVWWCPIPDGSDSTIDGTVLRYVGLNFAGIAAVYWTGCPIIAYAQ